jgi:hypothetical protein
VPLAGRKKSKSSWFEPASIDAESVRVGGSSHKACNESVEAVGLEGLLARVAMQQQNIFWLGKFVLQMAMVVSPN